MLHNETLHYLDNAATTIVDEAVADAVRKAMVEHWANPSSLYGPGCESRRLLEKDPQLELPEHKLLKEKVELLYKINSAGFN